MDKSILQKYTRDAESAGSNVVDLDLADDLGAFGWQRGIRDRCLMLELRSKGGNMLALGYAWLHRIEFDASEGITLWFAGRKVIIRGRNLNSEVRPTVRLLDGLTQHRVPWIQEASQADAMESPADACVVEAIAWDKAR
jgi:hypothetical protein